MTTDQKNELLLKLLDEQISGEEFQHLQQLLLEDDETLELYREPIILGTCVGERDNIALMSGNPVLQSVRISNQNTAQKSYAYLDFDNVRVTRMKY